MIKNKLAIRITIKLLKGKKRIYSYTGISRRLFHSRLRGRTYDKGYIKVDYGNGFTNDAEFNNFKDAKWYLTTFTEARLVRTIQGFQK